LSKKKIKILKKSLNDMIGKKYKQYIYPFSKLCLQERYCTLKKYNSFLKIMKNWQNALMKIFPKII